MSRSNVCVLGGAGFIGSWLVRKLLGRGHVVHATLRNKDDPAKAGLLNSFPGAESRLRLFQVDLADESADFDSAISRCELVFQVATLYLHPTDNPEGADTTDPTISAARRIVESCIRSGTVRRLVYVASVLAASPVLDDESGLFGDCIDETCWTPLTVPFSYCQQYEWAYIRTKTATEKEILKYNRTSDSGLRMVSVVSALVGGDTALSSVPGSAKVVLAPLIGETRTFQRLKMMQAVCGCVPLVHVDDLCEALVFCAEAKEFAGGGRVLCATGYPSTHEIVGMYRESHGERVMLREGDLEPEMSKKVKRGSTKLVELGFKYKHDVKDLLEATAACWRRLGQLPAAE